MNKLLIILCLQLVGFSAFAQLSPELLKSYTKTIVLEHEGHDREFIIFNPPAAIRKPKAPVVFMFHGTSGDGLKFYNISQWKEKALEEGFIAVFPSSLAYRICEEGRAPRVTTKWVTPNIYDILCDPNDYLADDQVFFQKMVSFLKENFPIDDRRIYASGFSNGSGFVQQLLIHNSHLLAAAAGNGGLRITDTPEESIPFFSTIGSKDTNILENVGLEELPLNRSYFGIPEIQELVIMSLENLGLKKEFTFTKKRRTFHAVFSTDIKDENKNTELNILVLDDLTHKYPNGKNYPLRMVDILWPFFSRFSK